jgi:predicted phage tail protein
VGFYLYKGLKKPLVFFGLKGKYIFHAVGVIGVGVTAALILSKFGLLGSLLGIAVTAGGVYLIFKRQDKHGLYAKTKNNNQILIFPKRMSNSKLLNQTSRKG